LTAEQLFHTKADGSEELTPKGKSELNSAIKGYGGRVLENPIMVEGYADTDDAADRMALSRHRAILVRNYLQGHFSLDSARIGSLALENRPPDGLAHSTWDGVAIVLLKTKR
jgi:hypothetical protein